MFVLEEEVVVVGVGVGVGVVVGVVVVVAAAAAAQYWYAPLNPKSRHQTACKAKRSPPCRSKVALLLVLTGLAVTPGVQGLGFGVLGFRGPGFVLQGLGFRSRSWITGSRA